MLTTFWRRYSLSIVLFACFTLSWLAQAYYQIVVNEETWGEFLAATFENWQSEFLQLLTFVLFSARLVHQGSPQSKTTDDETQAHLERIERRLRNMERRDG